MLELVPLGHHDQRIAAFGQRRTGPAAQRDVGHDALGARAWRPDRSPHLGALAHAACARSRCSGASRMSSVLGLNARPKQADRLAVAACPAARAASWTTCRRWSRLISITARSSCGCAPCSERHVLQRLDVLREAASAVADARIQEGAADALVVAHARGDFLDVRARRFSQMLAISLMKEMRVARKALEAYLIISAVRRSVTMIGARSGQVQLRHLLGRIAVERAEHDPVGVHEVGEGRAFAQELGAGHHREGDRLGLVLADDVGHPVAGAHRAPCSC